MKCLRTDATWAGAAPVIACQPAAVSVRTAPRPSEGQSRRATRPRCSIRAT